MRPSSLERMFHPRSVAVVGANNRPHRVGHVIMHNLLAGGFDGPIMPVNPRYDAVAGVLTYPDVASLPRTPDLAILCTPPARSPTSWTSSGRAERGRSWSSPARSAS